MAKTVNKFLKEIESNKWRDLNKPVQVQDRDQAWVKPCLKVNYSNGKPVCVLISDMPFAKGAPMMADFVADLKALPQELQELNLFLEAPNGLHFEPKQKVVVPDGSFDFSDENVRQFVIAWE